MPFLDASNLVLLLLYEYLFLFSKFKDLKEKGEQYIFIAWALSLMAEICDSYYMITEWLAIYFKICNIIFQKELVLTSIK